MSTSTQALAGTFEADRWHSTFQFAVRHMGVGTFKATFDDVDVTVVGDGGGVRLDGAVRVASVSIKQPDFRAHVLDGPDFFDAPHHPEITFRSTGVELGADGTATVDGELTIKGITKPFHATGEYSGPVEDIQGTPRVAVDLEATVDRRDWGFTWQAPLPKGGEALGYQVTLAVHAELVQRS